MCSKSIFGSAVWPKTPWATSNLAPLFTHIVADQFARTRAEDDTFATLDPALGADIIAEIQSSNFATIIICTMDVDMVQDDVFIASDRSLSDLDTVSTSWRDDLINLAAKTLNGSVYTGFGDDTVLLSGGTVITGNVQMVQGSDTLIATNWGDHRRRQNRQRRRYRQPARHGGCVGGCDPRKRRRHGHDG